MLFEIRHLKVGEVKAPSAEYDNLYIYDNLYNKTI